MPSIVSITKSGITGVDLGGAAWKLQLRETAIRVNEQTTDFYFGAVFAYPPASMELMNFSLMSLIRTHIMVAEAAGEVQRIVDVALDGGSLESDQTRTREAFELFRNRPRIKSTALEADIESSNLILDVYWKLQEWVAEGMKDEKEIIELGTKLILRP